MGLIVNTCSVRILKWVCMQPITCISGIYSPFMIQLKTFARKNVTEELYHFPYDKIRVLYYIVSQNTKIIDFNLSSISS